MATTPLALKQFDDAVAAGLERATKLGVYAVIRLQDVNLVRFVYRESAIENSSYNNQCGAGIYVFTQSGHVAFGATNQVTPASIEQMVERLAAVAKENEKNNTEPAAEIFQLSKQAPLEQEIPQADFTLEDANQDTMAKITSAIQLAVAKADPEATIISYLVYEHEQWRIARSDGTDVSFALPKCWLVTMVTVRDGEDSTEFYLRTAAISIPELEANMPDFIGKVKERTRMAKQQLKGEQLPSGHYPILLDYELVGLLAHEALGHPAESDAVAAGSSVLATEALGYRKDDQVAASGVNISDHEPELAHGFHPYGSFGNARQPVTIIKDGKLTESISDVFSGTRIGVKNLNCERAETFKDVAIPRMSNTYVWLNDYKLIADQVEDTSPEAVQQLMKEKGIFKDHSEILYLIGGKGGSVSPNTGDFMFGSGFAYKLTAEAVTALRPVSFSGNVLEALKSIEFGVGELRKDDFGFCGKSDQRANVNDGGHELIFMSPTEHVSIA